MNHVTVFHVPVTKVGTNHVVGVISKLKVGQDGTFRSQVLLHASVSIPFPSSHASDHSKYPFPQPVHE